MDSFHIVFTHCRLGLDIFISNIRNEHLLKKKNFTLLRFKLVNYEDIRKRERNRAYSFYDEKKKTERSLYKVLNKHCYRSLEK
jgi:hypothetical protein